MVFVRKAIGWFWSGTLLAGLALAACPSASLAGDVSRQEAGRLDAGALARLIDQAIQERLSLEGAAPAPRADDAEFLRRAYLDITGVIPPADKVLVFLDSKHPDKRARLI